MADSKLWSDRATTAALALCSVAALELLRQRSKARAKNNEEGAVPEVNTTKLPLVGHLPAVAQAFEKEGAFTWAVHRVLLDNSDNAEGICRLKINKVESIFVYRPELVQEIFEKPHIFSKEGVDRNPFFKIARRVLGQGLFTCGDEEPEWGIGHRILTKPFSRQGMLNFVPLMNEQGNALVEALKAQGDGARIDLYDWVQKMAFETISVCGMGTSFGSFDSKEKHQFILAMEEWLGLIKKTGLSPVWKSTRPGDKRMEELGNVLMDYVRDVIRKRRNKETQPLGDMPDLLDLMLNSKDAKTGQGLSEENIMQQILTFLVAGHDSTAAAMSSTLNHIFANPSVEARVVEEIRTVVGTGDVTWDHLSKLKYLTWCQSEALRLCPPAGFATKFVLEDTMLGGKWQIRRGDIVRACPLATQLNPTVWGSDAHEFKPERWEPGLPHAYAYFPFSMGPRGCIGKEFSLVEQKIALVKLLQNFVMRVPKKIEPHVQDNIFVGVTSKVDIFQRPPILCPPALQTSVELGSAAEALVWQVKEESKDHGTPLLVLHGSNGGSTKAFACAAAQEARRLGFAPTVAELDRYADLTALQSASKHVLVVSATYNGLAPDSAEAFVKQSQACSDGSVLGAVTYAVFGCGNTQWANSYQKIPMLLDAQLEKLGGQRLLKRGEGDSAADIDADFAVWCDAFWPALATSASVSLDRVAAGRNIRELPEVRILPNRCAYEKLMPASEHFKPFEVLEKRELIPDDPQGSVTHLELALPDDVHYAAGDHLMVLPENDPHDVAKLLKRLNVAGDVVVEVDSLSRLEDGGDGHPSSSQCALDSDVYLMRNRPLRLRDVLASCYDLSKALSGASVEQLAALAKSEADKRILSVLDKATLHKMQMPLIEVLERFPSLQPTLSEVLALLPVMKPRLYSISSSDLASRDCLSIMVGLLEGTTASGRLHQGVCSHFVASRQPGQRVLAAVKSTGTTFRLPPIDAPVVMIGAGTGLAPFRGFMQERHELQRSGGATGATHLFFGCRYAEAHLIKDELESWQAAGSLQAVNVAYSRTGKKQYVQDLIRENEREIWELLSSGAHFFVCGDAARMAPAVKGAIIDVAMKTGGQTRADAEVFVSQLRTGERRYHEDVWSANA